MNRETAGVIVRGRWKAGGIAMAVTVAGAMALPTAIPASAQSVGSYQLPPAPATPAPRAAGPVDEGGPTPTPVASPSATPAIVIPTPTAAARRPAPRPTPRAAQPAPAAKPIETPTPTATPTQAPPAPVASPESAPPAAPPEATPPAVPMAPAPQSAPSWPLYAALAALALAALALAALGAAAWYRRKPRPPALPAPQPPRSADRAPTPSAPPPAPTPVPAIEPLAAAPADLAFTLEATRLSATLVNATLAYRLVVSNHGSVPLADIAIGGDMTSAHASRAMEEQLGITGPELPPLHRIAALGAGESVVLGGEMRLPLSAVLPIRNGDAQLFVPLARFDGWASAPDGKGVHARAAFLIGQENQSQPRLAPFRLDLGPRVYDQLGQRPLPIPA